MNGICNLKNLVNQATIFLKRKRSKHELLSQRFKNIHNGQIATTSNINIQTLSRRDITALKYLSKNIITPDKFDIMGSTQYNNKLVELSVDKNIWTESPETIIKNINIFDII